MPSDAAARHDPDRSTAWLHAALAQTQAGRFLDRLDWVAALPNPAAPRFVFLAGACGGTPVGGSGTGLADAAIRLAGETAEVLAQAAPLPPGDHPAVPGLDAIWTAAAAPARVTATDLADGSPAGVPAAAIFPAHAGARHGSAPPQSLGLAAGPDREAARLAGLLELVERDAAARWWTGATLPCAPDPLDTDASALATLRDGAGIPRATTLLALPAVAGVPVFCALSRGADGRGLAFGLKAALTPAAAAAGAILELLQMEIALDMAAHRAARGAATPGDATALARAALDPELPAFAARPARPAPPPPADLATLTARLHAAGCRLLAVDLVTPEDAPAVAKILATGLMPFPGGTAPARPDSPASLAPLM